MSIFENTPNRRSVQINNFKKIYLLESVRKFKVNTGNLVVNQMATRLIFRPLFAQVGNGKTRIDDAANFSIVHIRESSAGHLTGKFAYPAETERLPRKRALN